MKYLCLCTFCFLLCFKCIKAQDSFKSEQLFLTHQKTLTALNKKTSFIEGKLDKGTTHYLSKLQRQEQKLKKKLWRKDSALAKQLFEGVEQKYQQLQKAPQGISKYSSVYSGHLDSLTTSLNFLKDKGLVNGAGVEQTLSKYSSLQSKLNQTDNLKKYIGERQKLLKQQLESVGMLKELRGFQKQAYYYQAQVREYKELWEDPNKMEQKLMEAVLQVPQFKEFFAQNSTLGSLFALPGSSASSASVPPGLQTRASVNQALTDRFGAGPNTTQLLQQNLQSAQGELSSLKSKINQYSTGSYGNSSTDPELPEGFKPNHQKTKSFLRRLEYGANVQSGRGSNYFPVTSDLGLSLGYKLSDKSVIGVGASYKLGWGSSWNNIRLSYQGVGLRSYLDLKVKGTFYISGGYEQNYRSEIHSIQQLKEYSTWQSSGLVGLSKKYKLGGKMKGEMKLLWDFLSYRQVPRTQAILFRIGYSLK